MMDRILPPVDARERVDGTNGSRDIGRSRAVDQLFDLLCAMRWPGGLSALWQALAGDPPRGWQPPIAQFDQLCGVRGAGFRVLTAEDVPERW